MKCKKANTDLDAPEEEQPLNFISEGNKIPNLGDFWSLNTLIS